MAMALLITLVVLTMLLFLHDLVPLGRWNNVGNDRREPLLPVLANVIPNTLVGLVPSYLAWKTLHAHGRPARIAITLSIVLLGELFSWWIPWLFGTTEGRRKQLNAITDGTLSFVRSRHGVTPNALHCIIHLFDASCAARECPAQQSLTSELRLRFAEMHQGSLMYRRLASQSSCALCIR